MYKRIISIVIEVGDDVKVGNVLLPLHDRLRFVTVCLHFLPLHDGLRFLPLHGSYEKAETGVEGGGRWIGDAHSTECVSSCLPLVYAR